MDKISTKEKLLETAMRILKEEGSEKLTLEYLAKKTGISKGGLLYHFPNKESIILEIIQRMVDHFEKRLQSSQTKSDQITTWSIDYFHSTMEDLAESDLQRSGIIAALASYPQLLEPLKKKYNQWDTEMKKDISNPILSSIIRYAADGIWFNEVLGFSKLTKKEKIKLTFEVKKLMRIKE
jgi:AcrR family transcriptional regulator